jgi:hypothetical protein
MVPSVIWKENKRVSFSKTKKRFSLCIYLFIMPCQFHTVISAQIQTQEYTNYQSINGRVYATALRQLQQPLQNEHDTIYIRS